MILKLHDPKGRVVFIDTRNVLLTEQLTTGWRVTTSALGPIQMSASVTITNASANRWIDFDDQGAKPLIDHLNAGLGLP